MLTQNCNVTLMRPISLVGRDAEKLLTQAGISVTVIYKEIDSRITLNTPENGIYRGIDGVSEYVNYIKSLHE
jgi:hypothetical protein